MFTRFELLFSQLHLFVTAVNDPVYAKILSWSNPELFRASRANGSVPFENDELLGYI